MSVVEFKVDVDNLPLHIWTYNQLYKFLGISDLLDSLDYELNLNNIYCTEFTDIEIKNKLCNNLRYSKKRVYVENNRIQLPALEELVFREDRRPLKVREKTALELDYHRNSPSWKKEKGLKHYIIYVDLEPPTEYKIKRFTKNNLEHKIGGVKL